MNDVDAAADKAFQALCEMFSHPMDPCKGRGRKYVLDFVGGRPTFRRDEIDLLIENAIEKAYGPAGQDCGNEIVPKKLNKIFPDLPQEPLQDG